MTDLKHILIVDLHPHPKNPRLSPRADVVEMITGQLGKEMDEAHALIVRPNADGYEIISGHHRKLAAEKAGLRKLPCWVREMTDEEAYMALVRCNAQGELHPLEIGLHAFDSKMVLDQYALKIGKQIGKSRGALAHYHRAAVVVRQIGVEPRKFLNKIYQLCEIHRAPQEHWATLAQQMLRNEWSIDGTRNEVEECIRKAKLAASKKNLSRTERKIVQRTMITLDDWKEMTPEERKTALMITAKAKDTPSFNKQESADIEWAMQSWNPITGCLHDCPYCYARDIAKQKKMRKVYPHGFEPVIHPMRLLAPQGTKVPKQADDDIRYKNVFTGSMADIFGRWVPPEWIEAVLIQVRAAPQWNFLFLTKFPKHILEFDIPRNAWMGTTVDLQARVANAEVAFAKLRDGGYKGIAFLSVEPMIEPIKFKQLELFNWLIIGGASASRQTPEFRPPFRWIADLYEQAKAANCKVYMKTNLLGNRLLELPFDAPVKQDIQEAPKVFKYLGKTNAA